MRKGVSDSDGSGSQHQQLHYGSVDPHHQQHHQLAMHNLQVSQVNLSSRPSKLNYQ